MKQIILIGFLLLGCSHREIKEPMITYKSYEGFFGGSLPNKICRFGYQKCENCEFIEFQDSCKLYKIGDRLYKEGGAFTSKQQ